MRVTDPLLPQIAEAFAIPIGDAAIVATAFTIAYGISQVFYGLLGDRIGKYTVVTFAVLVSGLGTAAGAFAGDVPVLAALRLLSGSTAGAIIPLGMAYVGDVVPFEQRQAVLAKFISGQIIGMLAGQALGGILGEYVGWRGALLCLGALFILVFFMLAAERRSGRVVEVTTGGSASVLRQYKTLLQSGRVRLITGTAFVEGMLAWGGLTFIGAYLRQAYGLGFDTVGLLLATFGLGGLVYVTTARQFLGKLGERRMVRLGGATLGLAFLCIAAAPPIWMFVPLIIASGMGFYLMHNTLQTHATQMAPKSRGLGVSFFASCFFLGQSLGITLLGWTVDHIGFERAFVWVGVLIAALAAFFAWRLSRDADGMS